MGLCLTKTSQIKSPADKYCFVEENDPRGYNINSWVIDPGAGAAGNNWSDPLTVWHNSKSNLGFLDGHSETWKWSRETLDFFMDFEAWNSAMSPLTPDGIEDLKRIQRGWAE